jgi:Chaperonin GroEL (HSP60 family)
MQLAGQPVIILKENVERTRGQEALRSNIMAAKAIAAAVRTTLGPRGMDKMLVSGTSDVVVTNDGATILHELSIQHPGGKMVVEVAETQDDMVGDGTTTAVILVGALMESAEQMISQGIHPTVIAEGFRMGMTRALEIVKELAITVKPEDKKNAHADRGYCHDRKIHRISQGKGGCHRGRCGDGDRPEDRWTYRLR